MLNITRYYPFTLIFEPILKLLIKIKNIVILIIILYFCLITLSVAYGGCFYENKNKFLYTSKKHLALHDIAASSGKCIDYIEAAIWYDQVVYEAGKAWLSCEGWDLKEKADVEKKLILMKKGEAWFLNLMLSHSGCIK